MSAQKRHSKSTLVLCLIRLRDSLSLGWDGLAFWFLEASQPRRKRPLLTGECRTILPSKSPSGSVIDDRNLRRLSISPVTGPFFAGCRPVKCVVHFAGWLQNSGLPTGSQRITSALELRRTRPKTCCDPLLTSPIHRMSMVPRVQNSSRSAAQRRIVAVCCVTPCPRRQLFGETISDRA